MPDALTYTPSDRQRSRTGSADADLAAAVRRAIAVRERRRREEERGGDPGDDSGTSPDLLTVPSSSAALSASGSDVDLSLGGVSTLPPLASPAARVAARGRAARGGTVDLAAPLAPGDAGGGDGSDSATGGIGEASFDPGPNLNPTFEAGPVSLSPFSGLTIGTGGRFGSINASASPVSGVGVGVNATPSQSPLVNLALNSVLRAAGIPLSQTIASGFAPAAALGIFGPIAALARAIAASEPSVRGTLTAMRGNDPETQAAVLNNVDAAIAQALATGVGPRVTDPQEATMIAMRLNGFNAPIAQFADGRGGWITMNVSTLNSPTMDPENPSASNPANFNNTTNLGRGANPDDEPATVDSPPAVPDAPPDESATVDSPPGGPAGGSSGTGGVSGGTGPSGPGTGEAPYLATWAMQGLGIGPDERRERGWAAFKKSFDKRFPLTGEAQFRRYARLARQVVEALERRPLEEQRHLQRVIYARIVAPLGETLELHEVDEAWTAMRTTALLLAKRLGLTVDPADVPQPVHEVAARARQRQQARVKAARERAAAEDAAAPGDPKDRSA